VLNKETVKQQIKELIEKYDKVAEENRVSEYNEEMTKKDFILPLFRALGWNVEDSSEVTAEETISKKRVDYGFRINGIPKFFLEAKALKVNLGDPKFIEQAIDYAWHKGCTWAVLTDFENIKVFNAEWKTTDLLQSMFFSLECHQFLERFDQLWLLSKESFEQGLIDKEAEKWGKKSKKTPVGEQLFSDLTKWRSELSKDILLRNRDKNLTEEDLDEAVQRIIDRLIFIRNCEDREMEPPTLLSTVREWESKRKGSLAEYIFKVFRHFDDEYNSKLFQHHLCDDLDVSNQVLEGIIEDLYHTRDGAIKYDFSALDADILGNVYEQYLGHILKKTAKRAKVEAKHAYRKEQGIYYTPTYIVDYIVRNTLGELLKDKNVDVEKIRVLDPACGSGSFLIKAFDVLNEFYSRKGGSAPTQLDSATGLPFKQKERILLDNIFGVDLDPRAVEIAQLNLLLKVAEKKQRLPLLQQNIICGNSLIDDEKVARNKAFKWEEKFKQVMDEGGFDVVIGNPPYGAEFNRLEKTYIEDKYECFGSKDSAEVFLELALKLTKENGIVGMIIPKSLAFYTAWSNIRKFILREASVVKLCDVGIAFKDVNYEQLILIIKNSRASANAEAIIDRTTPLKRYLPKKEIHTLGKVRHHIMELENRLIFSPVPDKIEEVLLKIHKNSVPLRSIAKEIFRGLYIPDEVKKTLKPGKYKFLEKVPHVSRYRIKKLLEVDLSNAKWKNKIQKILQPRVFLKVLRGKRLVAGYDFGEIVTTEKLVNIVLKEDSGYDIRFITAVINSTIPSFYVQKTLFSDTTETSRVMDEDYSGTIPIPKNSPQMQSMQTEIVGLVEKMISLNKRLNEIGDKKTDERQRIEEEIKKTDAEIDELVYKLYGITEEEKKIIEESLK